MNTRKKRFRGIDDSILYGNIFEKRKARYKWKSEKTKALRILRASLAAKKKAGWSREIGFGFIAEDIVEFYLYPQKKIVICLVDIDLTLSPSELNLLETEEAIKFLEEAKTDGSQV